MTSGARARGISQPAASQQVSALSRAAGGPLFTRTRDGVMPTSRGRELYADVAESLDRLEDLLVELDGGRISPASPPIRLGSSGDLFDGFVLPRMTGGSVKVTATFGSETELFDQLASGEIDLAVTLASPDRRAVLDTRVVGTREFALITSGHGAPSPPLTEPAEIATSLEGRPWVSYSHELPRTRRFWSAYLGMPFEAHVALIAPDLRSVVNAVRLGWGVSLVPHYACRRDLDERAVAQFCRLGDVFAGEPIYASLRRVDTAHLELQNFVSMLHEGGPLPKLQQPRKAL